MTSIALRGCKCIKTRGPVALSAVLAAVLASMPFGVDAKTVGYWPLALPNGTIATTETAFENIGTGENLTAYPVSLDASAKIVEGESPRPVVGTNAFPSGYGVYDPVAGVTREAATAAKFDASAWGVKMACLRVPDSSALRLKTFTVECFVRIPTDTMSGWHCIAVMPGQLWKDGKQVANCDSWGLRVTDKDTFKLRFFGSDYTLSERPANNDYIAASSSKTEQDYNRPGAFDDRWHHVAFSVNDETKEVVFYYDYVPGGTVTLKDSVWYGENESLFIGATPQTFGGSNFSIAHFRISDEALPPDRMLRFARTSPAADEDPDALLHIDFEPVDGISDNNVFFNDAATGSAVFRSCRPFNLSKVSYPVSHEDVPAEVVYTSLADAVGRMNGHCVSNTYDEGVCSAVYWQPESDVFTNSSFTLECCYKTEKNAQWQPMIRRVGGVGVNTVQFNLGFGDNAAKVAVKVFSGETGATPYAVNDTTGTADGQWHHVAAVFNRPLKKMYLYRDYELIGSTGYPGYLWPTNTPVYITATPSKTGSWNPFPGCIDNVRITRRALSVGEFLVPVRGRSGSASDKTLAWATFDSSLDATQSEYLATNGVASAESGGAEPTLDVFGNGGKISLTDGNGALLREGDMAALAFSGGSVVYPDNPMLAACHDMTVEFFVRCGVQTAGAGLVQAGMHKNNSDTLSWGLYFDSTGRKLHVRCATIGEDSWSATAIDEDTTVDVTDSRWHHIALSFSEDASGVSVSTTVNIRKDYDADASWSCVVPGRVFYDSGSGDVRLALGRSTVTSGLFSGKINELRISKGVLAVKELLRRQTPAGLMLIVR